MVEYTYSTQIKAPFISSYIEGSYLLDYTVIMIYTYLFQKDVTDCSWDVAHLYEHAFCHAFFDYLSRNDINPGVYGFLNAEAFAHSIFVYACFYNKKAADLFEKFIRINNVSEKSIDKPLAEIGIEDKLSYTIIDPVKFYSQFHSINQAIWTNVSLLKTARYLDKTSLITSPFTKKNSAKSYRDIIISYYIENGTLNENTLMLRWSVMLEDIIRTSLNDDMTCYVTDCSPAYDIEANTIGRTQIMRFLRNVRIQDVQEKVEKTIKTFDVEKNFSYIQDHFNEYSNQPTWRDDPIVYYKFNNIITSNSYINSLATLDNLLLLTSKIRVKVQNYTQASSNHLRKRLDK